jgi:hypothetical protein
MNKNGASVDKPTQGKMAELIGISQPHLSRIFKTGIAGRRTCERLAQLIGGKWTDYAEMHAEQLEKAIREGLAIVIEHRAN